MRADVASFIDRLSRDPALAERFFADPDGVLAGLTLAPEDREALARLDPERLAWMQRAHGEEPELAPEHPDSARVGRGITVLIGLWGCVACVVFWLLAGGSR